MAGFDAYFSGDELTKQKAYDEFKLSKEDRESIEAIENSLASKTLNSNNCLDSLDYLEKLSTKIRAIKRNEMEYEGDTNENVNDYLEQIHSLILKIKHL